MMRKKFFIQAIRGDEKSGAKKTISAISQSVGLLAIPQIASRLQNLRAGFVTNSTTAANSATRDAIDSLGGQGWTEGKPRWRFSWASAAPPAPATLSHEFFETNAKRHDEKILPPTLSSSPVSPCQQSPDGKWHRAA
jgi:hypothetical protein